jgi:hypothetical protein
MNKVFRKVDCIYTEIPGYFSHIIKGLLIGQIQDCLDGKKDKAE